MRIGWLDRRARESYDELRARLVEETSLFLTDALQHPELAVRIPMIQAGRGTFPASLAAAFWEPILSE